MSDEKVRIVEVTFPVRVRVRAETAQNRHDLKDLRDDLQQLVLDACLDDPDDGKRPLYCSTPPDNGLGHFGVVVDAPTVQLPEYLYETSR